MVEVSEREVKMIRVSEILSELQVFYIPRQLHPGTIAKIKEGLGRMRALTDECSTLIAELEATAEPAPPVQQA